MHASFTPPPASAAFSLALGPPPPPPRACIPPPSLPQAAAAASLALAKSPDKLARSLARMDPARLIEVLDLDIDTTLLQVRHAAGGTRLWLGGGGVMQQGHTPVAGWGEARICAVTLFAHTYGARGGGGVHSLTPCPHKCSRPYHRKCVVSWTIEKVSRCPPTLLLAPHPTPKAPSTCLQASSAASPLPHMNPQQSHPYHTPLEHALSHTPGACPITHPWSMPYHTPLEHALSHTPACPITHPCMPYHTPLEHALSHTPGACPPPPLPPVPLAACPPLACAVCVQASSAVPPLPRRLLGPHWQDSLGRHTTATLDLTHKTVLSVADWKRRAGYM